MNAELHERCANTIRGLAMDAVQAASSGHPGMPMGTADIATVLWTRFLKFDPAAPAWPDRDRFVLSAGHGSMLQYALLHLAGFDLPLSELMAFRQWGSRTPGHPEVGHTAGVETTTGPLGQGIGNAVGLAIAERYLRETFGADLVDHRTYVICSDGDLMEGISSEAASLAGHLGLDRLIVLYDDNQISIDGKTGLAFSEDVPGRFVAQGWRAERVDGHDADALAAALERARASERPSLIACRTVIGRGSPNLAGSEKSHGAPLGAEEVARTKAALGLDPEQKFVVPADVAAAFRGAAAADRRAAWEARVAAHPRGAELMRWLQADWRAVAKQIQWPTFEKPLATRKASAACLKAIVAAAPMFVGGSADLSESNGVEIGRRPMSREGFAGTGGVHFGVREHAMAAICNGVALHGGLRPFGATFLVFHDYHRPSVRLSALMKLPVVYVYSHDSIWLGEDGPTHQPIDTLPALRLIPGLEVWRPADPTETAVAWREILAHTEGPSALLLTRQDLPLLPASAEGAARGGHVVIAEADPQIVLVGTGSELSLCVAAHALLAERGVRARVVSLPCRERFLAQDRAYRNDVLPPTIPRLAVEAASTLGWERLLGDNGVVIGIDHFGASAPAKVLAEKFGFTAANVARVAEDLVQNGTVSDDNPASLAGGRRG